MTFVLLSNMPFFCQHSKPHYNFAKTSQFSVWLEKENHMIPLNHLTVLLSGLSGWYFTLTEAEYSSIEGSLHNNYLFFYALSMHLSCWMMQGYCCFLLFIAGIITIMPWSSHGLWSNCSCCHTRYSAKEPVTESMFGELSKGGLQQALLTLVWVPGAEKSP